MKLIVGLGNPGEKFENTRHNAGFMFVEALFIELHKNERNDTRLTTWEYEKMYDSDIAYLLSGSEKILMFMKPRTFMNNSGFAVRKVMEKNAVTKRNLVVAYDDMDIQLGKYKISHNKSPKGHNGILSIEKYVGSIDFLHVRMGVDSRTPEARIPGLDYVLMKMKKDEAELMNDSIMQAVSELKDTELKSTLQLQ